MLVGPAGGETDAAIAHHHAGDAVARRRRHPVLPGYLAVIMGVDVDEARGHDLALGVDLFLASAGNRPDSGDAAVADRDIGLEGLAARAIDDRTAANDQIEIDHAFPQCAAIARDDRGEIDGPYRR